MGFWCLLVTLISFVDACCSWRRCGCLSCWRRRLWHSLPHLQAASLTLKNHFCRMSCGRRWDFQSHSLPSVTHWLFTANFSSKYSFKAVIGCLASIATPIFDSDLAWLIRSAREQAASPYSHLLAHFLMTTALLSRLLMAILDYLKRVLRCACLAKLAHYLGLNRQRHRRYLLPLTMTN